MSRSHRSERRERLHRHRKSSRHHEHHGKTEHRHSRSRRHRRVSPEKPPAVPRDFHCHICGKNHWTVDCDRLRQQPENYPLMNAVHGCRKCGQKGHAAAQCRIQKYLCRDCGGMHDTRDCVFAHVGEDWYEFYDPHTRHVYYTNADESQVQWNPPTHELDPVYWYCCRCSVMISAKFRECLLCHSIRPESKETETFEDSSDSESDSSSSSSSSSSDRKSGSSDDDTTSSTSSSGSSSSLGDSTSSDSDSSSSSDDDGEEEQKNGVAPTKGSIEVS